MLLHHGSRNYNEAASDAANRAREKMEGLFETGRRKGATIINRVMTEVPTDHLVPGPRLRFDGDIYEREEGAPADILMRVDSKEDFEPLSIQKFAMGQICSRANIPTRYAEFLREPEQAGWGHKLLAENFNQLYSHDKDNFLTRSYDGRLRGFLSDRYRRLDSRPLLESFTGECQKYGLVPIEGYGSETKVALKALLPCVFEPVPNEVMCFGVMWENSDYGNGAHTIRAFAMRLWCTNYAITEVGFRQIHLGKRLTENMTWSNQTYALDTQATASQIRDVVNQGISPASIEAFCSVIKAANEQEIDPKKMMGDLSKYMNKGELEMVKDKYNEPDVVALPAGNTVWRMSNAISWVAGNKIDDDERKVEVMRVAGGLLERVAKKAA
jgi:hypothetical protein